MVTNRKALAPSCRLGCRLSEQAGLSLAQGSDILIHTSAYLESTRYNVFEFGFNFAMISTINSSSKQRDLVMPTLGCEHLTSTAKVKGCCHDTAGTRPLLRKLAILCSMLSFTPLGTTNFCKARNSHKKKTVNSRFRTAP